eukprot:10593147-Alexandrium_andersonii.AAC.1
MARRLATLDSAFAVVRHITAVYSEKFLQDVFEMIAHKVGAKRELDTQPSSANGVAPVESPPEASAIADVAASSDQNVLVGGGPKSPPREDLSEVPTTSGVAM